MNSQDELKILFPDEVESHQVEMGEDGEAHLIQDFPIPEGAMAVRMQVGGAPVTIVGWVDDPRAVPDLLENVASELRNILADQEQGDPECSGKHARP